MDFKKGLSMNRRSLHLVSMVLIVGIFAYFSQNGFSQEPGPSSKMGIDPSSKTFAWPICEFYDPFTGKPEFHFATYPDGSYVKLEGSNSGNTFVADIHRGYLEDLCNASLGATGKPGCEFFSFEGISVRPSSPNSWFSVGRLKSSQNIEYSPSASYPPHLEEDGSWVKKIKTMRRPQDPDDIAIGVSTALVFAAGVTCLTGDSVSRKRVSKGVGSLVLGWTVWKFVAGDDRFKRAGEVVKMVADMVK